MGGSDAGLAWVWPELSWPALPRAYAATAGARADIIDLGFTNLTATGLADARLGRALVLSLARDGRELARADIDDQGAYRLSFEPGG